MGISGKDKLYLLLLFIFGLIATSFGLWFSPLGKDPAAWIAFLLLYFITSGFIGLVAITLLAWANVSKDIDMLERLGRRNNEAVN
ncbi:hypothetical protein LCGC14_1391570 [marine sediment metagenome]|uniref:Uncharacterized protein n=1 Tax=marine sediment metagenome TaxID=412755 RepID=A0A0F9N1E9_9ZZZZ